MDRERMDGTRMIALVRAVLLRHDGTWTDLITFLHPHIEQIVAGSRSLGPLRGSEDHRRNVVTDVLAKLARNDHGSLAIFEHWLAANPDKTPGDWLRIVTTNVARDYVRKQLGGAPGPERDDQGAKKRLLHTLAVALPSDDRGPSLRPPVTDQQTARELLEYAELHLPPEQMRALEAWLQQADFTEVGRAAGVDEKELARGGEKLVRAALARLRRQFVVETE